MFTNCEFFVEGVVLRTNAYHGPYLIKIDLAEDGNKTIGGVYHPREHRD